MVAQQFDQVTYVCEEKNGFQNLKFKNFPNNAFETAKLWDMVGLTATSR